MKSIYKQYLFVALLSAVCMGYFFNRGFNYYDEGHVLHLAQRILQGDIPYRDFHFIYTPGTLYVTALAFKLFGVSILAGRIVLLLISILTSICVYALVKSLTGKFLPGIMAVLIYLAWAPTHINFIWPVICALLTGLFYTLSLRAYETTKKSGYLFISGLMLFATFFFKHNFGLALSGVAILFVLFHPKKRETVAYTGLGFLLPSLIYAAYLFATASFMPFIADMYYYTYLKIIHEGMLRTPFVYGTGPASIMKTAFFLLPAGIGVVSAFVLSVKRLSSRSTLYVLALPLGYYILGIRPTTDFIHTCPLIALSGIALCWTMASNDKRIVAAATGIGVVLIAAGTYTALFRGYYRWETPLIRQTTYIHNPRAGIFVDAKYADILTQMDRYFGKEKDKQFYMLIYEYAPTFYITTGAINPSSYDLLPSSAHTPAVEQTVLTQLRSHTVPYVLTDAPLSSRTPTSITRYIQQHYVKNISLYEFDIWVKK